MTLQIIIWYPTVGSRSDENRNSSFWVRTWIGPYNIICSECVIKAKSRLLGGYFVKFFMHGLEVLSLLALFPGGGPLF